MGAVRGVNPSDCYVYRSTAALWFKAEEDCTTRGGHLTSVSNALINAFLSDVADQKCATEVWFGGGWNTERWLKWTWTDNRPFKFTKWAQGQPANATTVLCLAFNAASTRWYSRPCTDAKPYICKVPALSNEPDTGEPSPAVCPTCEPPPTCPEAPTTALIKQVTCSPSATQSPCHCEPGQQSGNCEAGWTFNPWSTKCYKVLDTANVSWTDAQSACRSVEAELPSIHNYRDNAWLSAFTMGNQVVGIGLYRTDRNADWQWTDGSEVNFSNWAPNNPFLCAGNYNAAAFITDFDMQQPFGSWTNCYAYWTFPVVCQKAATKQ